MTDRDSLVGGDLALRPTAHGDAHEPFAARIRFATRRPASNTTRLFSAGVPINTPGTLSTLGFRRATARDALGKVLSTTAIRTRRFSGSSCDCFGGGCNCFCARGDCFSRASGHDFFGGRRSLRSNRRSTCGRGQIGEKLAHGMRRGIINTDETFATRILVISTGTPTLGTRTRFRSPSPEPSSDRFFLLPMH